MMHILNVETHAKETVHPTRIRFAKELKGFNIRTGWYVNWRKLFAVSGTGIYAVRTSDGAIQGLIALSNEKDNKAIKIEWAVAAPHNNKLKSINGRKTYEGVGACLFAIAARLSVNLGYNGYVHGNAANDKLLRHYIKRYGAEFFGGTHPYHFVIKERAASALLKEVYTNA